MRLNKRENNGPGDDQRSSGSCYGYLLRSCQVFGYDSVLTSCKVQNFGARKWIGGGRLLPKTGELTLRSLSKHLIASPAWLKIVFEQEIRHLD